MSEEIVYQCPECGSPAVEFSELAGGSASCSPCKWTGKKDDLLGTPFEHILGSREGVGFELVNDLRRVISTSPGFLANLGGFLNRWGFVDLDNPGPEVTKSMVRYMAVIARAVLKAIIEERKKIEEEKIR